MDMKDGLPAGRYCSKAAACEWAGVSVRTLDRMIADNEIAAFHFGKRGVRISTASLRKVMVPINPLAQKELRCLSH